MSMEVTDGYARSRASFRACRDVLLLRGYGGVPVSHCIHALLSRGPCASFAGVEIACQLMIGGTREPVYVSGARV